MALSKLSTGRKLAIKYLLAEELEDEETLFEIVRKPTAKIHDMFKLRCEEGLFNKLIIGHLREDKKKFSEFLRISTEQFDLLVELIRDDLAKNSTNLHLYPITPGEKLAITLR